VLNVSSAAFQKVMVCHFVGDSHEVMTALIVVLPLIVVVEISLQLHRSLSEQSYCGTHPLGS
jgi:hypothetical protein